MLRRSLRRFIPLAPRDVDRPPEHGKNDDTDPAKNTSSGPKGSRPRARNADPYLLPNPIPKDTAPLDKHHFLVLYDIFSKIDPTLEVKAFIADKSAYSFDMLVLTDDTKDKIQIKAKIDHVREELRHALVNHAGTKEAHFKTLVEFFDKREVHIGYGVKDVHPLMLNEVPDWPTRELYRSSLNYDWTKWELSWTIWFREVVDHLCAWSEYALDTEEQKIHRHYWAAQAFWARKRVFTDGTELYHFVCDNHVLTLYESLPHPILRFEDLHTCDFALDMKTILQTPESIFQMKQDTSMLSDEELKYIKTLDQKTMIDFKTRQEERKKEKMEMKAGKKKDGWLFHTD